jgi:hypothetical protein
MQGSDRQEARPASTAGIGAAGLIGRRAAGAYSAPSGRLTMT